MPLPSIASGKRYTVPRPTGSGDALLLAHFAQSRKALGQLTAILTADPADAQRLMDEMAFFVPDLRCAIFPDWETLPYDTFSPHQDLISERLATLWRMQQGVKAETGVDVVLLPATTALTRLAPPSFLAAYTFHFKQKQKLDEAALKSQLTLAGYNHVSQVVSPGEYAVRGGLIDLYPMGSLVPYRVDLFGDEVDSIRTFDPDSQRSLYPVPEVRLLPGREFPMDETARAAFRSRWRERMEGDPTRCRIYKDIGTGVATGGIEYYLPLFFDETSTLFQHLGEHAAVVLHGEITESLERFWNETRERHRFLQHDPERPLLAPEDIYLKAEEFFTHANAHAQLAVRGKEPTDWARPLPDLSVERGGQDPLRKLEKHIEQTDQVGQRVLVVAESAGRRENLMELLRDHRIDLPSVDTLDAFVCGDHRHAITAAPLAGGFIWHDGSASGTGIQFVTETELFDATPATRRRRKTEQATDIDSLIKDLSELNVGDPVVHSNHGIGRYQGLINLDLGDGPSEFLHLAYADQATLYVPVSQLHLISRYTGVSPEEAPLHKLGSPQWDKAKRKAAEQVRDTAAELLNLYARRATREGFAFRFSAQDYEAFATSFGFEETADQRAAIHAVIQDMISPRPMDRLVCGDVGFGKTEVALRAAFVAVTGGKQVV
ncbi:MAG: transcription-repair coupling factor, partial [Aquabacterium sp.]|nr:transcription-repair coupling factor [Aquabacterium sp.]